MKHDVDPSPSPLTPPVLAKLERRREALVQWLRSRDVGVLSGVLLAALLVWGFIELADAVGEDEAPSVDTRILMMLREPGRLTDPVGPPWLEETARDLTALGSWAVLTMAVVFSVGLLLLERRWRAALLVAVAVGGGMLLMTFLKAAFGRPRPDVVPHLVDVLTHSFPSGHATLSAVTYATLGALATQLARRSLVKLYLLAGSVFLSILVGLTRVYLGVHYPTDVAAGWSLGFAWATVCLVVTRLLIRRGTLRSENADTDPSELEDSGG